MKWALEKYGVGLWFALNGWNSKSEARLLLPTETAVHAKNTLLYC